MNMRFKRRKRWPTMTKKHTSESPRKGKIKLISGNIDLMRSKEGKKQRIEEVKRRQTKACSRHAKDIYSKRHVIERWTKVNER